jgi:hypothetical protein
MGLEMVQGAGSQAGKWVGSDCDSECASIVGLYRGGGETPKGGKVGLNT